ncbi:MAG: rhodanese-like domain-containing protein [Clostridia bacterium]|nr:rhodanese-like domain-containing protein [Clostridia bacterium]
MKKALVLLLILVLGCTFASISGCDNSEDREMTYTQITATEAKALMDSEENFIILDVRTDAEYAEGHIADAVLIPHEEITAKAEEVLLDKDQLILVYCRSGRRSKIAAEALVALGYTNVKEFGGIIDWPYEVVQ